MHVIQSCLISISIALNTASIKAEPVAKNIRPFSRINLSKGNIYLSYRAHYVGVESGRSSSIEYQLHDIALIKEFANHFELRLSDGDWATLS